MDISELQTLADEIENGIIGCEKDLRKVGSLKVKTQSLIHMLSKADQSAKEVKILTIRAKSLEKTVKQLGEKRLQQKQDLEQEMQKSQMRTRRISELEGGSEYSNANDDFFKNQSNTIDQYISSTMDSLESLTRQNVYIDRISNRLRDGVLRIGLSSDFLRKIEARTAGDKTVFYVLFMLVIIFILVLKFIF